MQYLLLEKSPPDLASPLARLSMPSDLWIEGLTLDCTEAVNIWATNVSRDRRSTQVGRPLYEDVLLPHFGDNALVRYAALFPELRWLRETPPPEFVIKRLIARQSYITLASPASQFSDRKMYSL